MPLYEYKCLDCGKLFELLCKLEQADNSHSCIYCGSLKTNRQLSRFFANNSTGAITRQSKTCNSCSDHCCGNCH